MSRFLWFTVYIESVVEPFHLREAPDWWFIGVLRQLCNRLGKGKANNAQKWLLHLQQRDFKNYHRQYTVYTVLTTCKNMVRNGVTYITILILILILILFYYMVYF